MDEGSGTTAYDESWNNNDGTLTNMNDSDWIEGKFGSALDFDGSDDYVSVASSSSFDTDPATFAFWTKANRASMDNDYKLYTKKAYDNLEFVDSNGAGDSFTVGFIVKLLESNNFDESLKFGNICGGISCTSRDLFNLEYTKDKMEEIMQNKKS